MRGFFKLGVSGLMTGMLIAFAVPSDAPAITSINVTDQNIQFPENVTETPTLPEGGMLIAFDGITDLPSSVSSLHTQDDAEDGLDGTDAADTPLGQPVSAAPSIQNDLQQGAPAQDGDDAVEFGSGETGGGEGAGSFAGVTGISVPTGGGASGSGPGGDPASSVSTGDDIGSSSFPPANGIGDIGSPAAGPLNGGFSPGPGANQAVAGGGGVSPVPADDGGVTTAPEPATWIMMIAGFWIVAWRLKKRSGDRQGAAAVPA